MKKKRYKYIHKVKNVIKDNIKLILGILIGITWTSGMAYAATILYASENVSYDNTSSGLTSTNVQDALDELYVESTSYQAFETRVTALENKVYPVGSVYISTTKSTTDEVASLFGGTWCAISQGRVLIGAGTNDGFTFEANSTGGSDTAQKNASGTITQGTINPLGEYTHKLVTNEMPSHNHSSTIESAGRGSAIANWGGRILRTNGNAYNENNGTNATGGNYYHNNIQPYLVVYMYKRVADNASC